MSLPAWTVKRNPKSRERSYSDAGLRRLIRKVSLSGLELVKSPLGQEWVPLHTLPLFREEATGAREAADTAVLAQNRSKAMGRFVGAMAVAGVVGIATGVAGIAGAQESALFLGVLSMLMLGAGWAAGMVAAVKYGGNSSGRRGTAVPAPALDQLELAVVALERSLAAAPPSVRDLVSLPAIRDGVVATRRKRTLLRSLQTPVDPRPELLTELATAKECAATATDAGAADAFADEVRSIEVLLSSLDRGMKAAAEADARERAMVNEIEALSHSVVRASIAGTAEDELLDRLTSLRRTLEEEEEIEQDLSRGVRKMGPVGT